MANVKIRYLIPLRDRVSLKIALLCMPKTVKPMLCNPEQYGTLQFMFILA
jgi:hypothetical protein